MLIFGLAQLAGALIVLWQPALPHPGVFLLSLPLVLAMAVRPGARWVAALWLGAALAAFVADRRLDDRLDAALDGEIVELTGRIHGLVEAEGERQRFRFRIESARWRGQPVALPADVRLTLYEPLAIAPGERWQWRAKLRRPRGFANPGGFDYERWLFAEGIGATGYVRDVARAKRLDAARGEWRAVIAARVAVAVDGPAAGLLRGLATGDRAGIGAADWETLRATGTAHLMAISGLHIALVTGLALLLARELRRRWLPRSAWSWPPLLAVAAAFAYGALAGFDLPVQRAVVAATVVLLALALKRRVLPAQAFGLALLTVLLLDPLAPLDAGFWLSFGAVGAILYALVGRRPRRSRWWRALAVQGALALLMAPLLLATFGRVPLVSPLANLIAIPVIDGFVVPLVLLGLALLPWPELAAAWLALPGWVLENLFVLLRWLAAIDPGWVPPRLPLWSLLLAALGLLLLCAPSALPGRWLALWLLLPTAALSLRSDGAPLAVHFLDVGQGLAVVVETPSHTLLYDTGPRFAASDTADMVVIPFLEARGRAPDVIMVSHGDSDHAGGAATLRRRYPAARFVGRAPGMDEDCSEATWQWDEASFRVLHPPRETAGTDNDHSCVLRIEYAGRAVLLTGDIEADAERRLLQSPGASGLRAQLVQIPHHGSRTSSTAAFVHAAGAWLAVAAAGHGNQWGFPKPDVLRRWQQAGAHTLDTGGQGMISVEFNEDGACVESFRQRRALWRDKPAAADPPCLRFDATHK